MEKNYNDIVEVKTVRTYQEANELLKHGWLLISSGARHEDSTGFQAKIYFTLGRREREK